MRTRNPEYERRDALFSEACKTCSRTSRCSFVTSLEGPEAVCKQLIEGGTYNCESCIRRNRHGGCVFTCCFFRLKLVEVSVIPVVAVSVELA